MKTEIFDAKQPTYTHSATGRTLICVNERVVQIAHPSNDPDSDEIQYVTGYQYDTCWVAPIKQSETEVLKEFKKLKIAEIEAYDVSSSVNCFTLNGIPMWLDRGTRLTLKNRMEAEAAVGKEHTVVWYEGMNIPMNIGDCLQLLIDLENYASQCYDITGNHKLAVSRAATIEEVGSIDISADYPKFPVYTLA